MNPFPCNPVLVIGIGNPLRRDDGAGWEVAEIIKERCIAGVETREQSGEGLTLIETWEGYQNVLIVDAASSGSPPGTVHWIEAHLQLIPPGLKPCSSHAFGVVEGLELARALHRLPRRLAVVGIEGKDFSTGIGLSPEVESATEEVANLIEREIRSNHSGGAGSPGANFHTREATPL